VTRPEPTEIPEVFPQAPGPTDLGHPVGRRQAKVHLGHHRDCFHVLQSPCGIIQILPRPYSTSVGMLWLLCTLKLKEKTSRHSSSVEKLP
jgi:hypothetical protein